MKVKYKFKAKGNEDKEISYIEKRSWLEWGNADGEIILIPTISLFINSNFSIEFQWLKLWYSQTWDIITFEEENERAEFRRNKNNEE